MNETSRPDRTLEEIAADAGATVVDFGLSALIARGYNIDVETVPTGAVVSLVSAKPVDGLDDHPIITAVVVWAPTLADAIARAVKATDR